MMTKLTYYPVIFVVHQNCPMRISFLVKHCLSLFQGMDCLRKGGVFGDGCLFRKRHHKFFYHGVFHVKPPWVTGLPVIIIR